MQKSNLLALFLAVAPLMSEAQKGLKDALAKHFLIGTSVSTQMVEGSDTSTINAIRQHFNAMVAGNAMKADATQPTEGVFDFRRGDLIADFAECNGLILTGHCLVWHSQLPVWFSQGKDGLQPTRNELIDRMRRHIFTVAGHYRGRVRGWDVVNEAFEDNGTLRHSPFSDIIGDDFIELAFRFAHGADPDAELYYNDYSLANPQKREAVCRLVRRLKAKGVRIDAVGMQSHLGLEYPDLRQYEASIDSFAACGVKVMVTELDVSVLPNPWDFSGADISQRFEYSDKLNPYPDGLPKEKAEELERRYLALFDIYRRHAAQISRVTLWGVSDRDSWLNDFPVKGRTNYPLLFDRDMKAKPMVDKIMSQFTPPRTPPCRCP